MHYTILLKLLTTILCSLGNVRGLTFLCHPILVGKSYSCKIFIVFQYVYVMETREAFLFPKYINTRKNLRYARIVDSISLSESS